MKWKLFTELGICDVLKYACNMYISTHHLKYHTGIVHDENGEDNKHDWSKNGNKKIMLAISNIISS